jgi:hypothetical protein
MSSAYNLDAEVLWIEKQKEKIKMARKKLITKLKIFTWLFDEVRKI